MDKDYELLEFLASKADEKNKEQDARLAEKMSGKKNKKNRKTSNHDNSEPNTDSAKRNTSEMQAVKQGEQPLPKIEKKEEPPKKKVSVPEPDASFGDLAEAMNRESSALEGSSGEKTETESKKRRSDPKIKEVTKKELGEEITKEQAEKVLSNKELGGRRRTVIVRTKIIDTDGNKISSDDSGPIPSDRMTAPTSERTEKPAAPSLCLIREQTGEVFDLDRDLTIGRDSDNDIVIPNPEGHYVSAHHAHIEVQGKDIYLKDLGSTNGTYVNDNKIASRRLKAGNKVEFGDIVFTVESI